MPNFYQTSGPDNDTLRCNSWNSSSFTTLWRAKDAGKRIKIVNIARAIYKNGKSGIKYVWGSSGVYNAMNGKSYNTNLKKAQKLKNKTTDCSHFVAACARGAKCSYGYMSSGDLKRANLSNFTKFDAQKEFQNETYQQGDIVCYSGNPGHVALVAHNGSKVKSSVFKNYEKDGSKKINDKKTNNIINKYCKHWKKKGVNKHDDSISQLQTYIDNLKKQRKTIQNKITNQKKKKQTEARKKYIQKLEKTKKTLTKAINYANDKLAKMKKKQTNKNKSKPKNVQQNTSQNDNEYDDEQIEKDQYAVDGNINFDDDESFNDDKEPELQPEAVNYYFIKSGPNYFSQAENSVAHKDYLGMIYCKRKIKVKTLSTTDSLWDFTFDMPFVSCSGYSSNIINVKKIANNHWQVFYKKNTQGQIIEEGAYVFKLKTSLGIEYEIRCEIDTYYDV